MDIITFLAIIAIFTLLWFYFTHNDNTRIEKLINQLPGPNTYPVFGTKLPLLFMKKHEMFCYLHSLSKNYGPIYRTWTGKQPFVHLVDPIHAEVILNSSVNITKGAVYDFLVPWLGDGLLTSKGAKWHRQRKLLTPAFHFKILETFLNTFVEKSKLLVNILSKKADKNEPFNIFPYVTRCTLDMITETAMGIEINAMSKETNSYVEALYGVCTGVVERRDRSWLASNFVYWKTNYGKRFKKYLSLLHDTTNNVIHERKKALSQMSNNLSGSPEDDVGSKKRNTFLDILLEASKDNTSLTHEEIREEVDTFLFEGHDTTTASICWTLFLLGLHPDIQEDVYKEISQIFHNDEPIEFANLNNLKYLERVIKEALRLFPSVAAISRRILKDVQIDKYIIPSGTTVSIQIFDIHRNEKYYPESGTFDPDRFLPENCKNRHPYAYIPFSAGPRNCIGQKFALTEEKITLSYLIKNFKIKSMQTIDNVHPVSELILRPYEGIFVTLEKRAGV